MEKSASENPGPRLDLADKSVESMIIAVPDSYVAVKPKTARPERGIAARKSSFFVFRLKGSPTLRVTGDKESNRTNTPARKVTKRRVSNGWLGNS